MTPRSKDNLGELKESIFDNSSNSEEQVEELEDLEKNSEKQPTSAKVINEVAKSPREEFLNTEDRYSHERSSHSPKVVEGLDFDDLEDDHEAEKQSTDKGKAANLFFGLSENNGDENTRRDTFSFSSAEDDKPNPYAPLVGIQTRSEPWKTGSVQKGDDHSFLSKGVGEDKSEAKGGVSEEEGEGNSKIGNGGSGHEDENKHSGSEHERESEHESGSEHERGSEHESGSEQDDDGGSDKDQNDKLPLEKSESENSTKNILNEPQIWETNPQLSIPSVEKHVPLYPVLNFDDEKIPSDKSDPHTTGDRSPAKTNPSIKRPKQLNEDESSDDQDDSQKKEPRFTKASHGHSSSHPLESRLSKVPGAKIIIGDPTLDEDEEDKVSFVARQVTLTNAVITINQQALEAAGEKLDAITMNLKETEKIQVLFEWTKDGFIITSSKD